MEMLHITVFCSIITSLLATGHESGRLSRRAVKQRLACKKCRCVCYAHVGTHASQVQGYSTDTCTKMSAEMETGAEIWRRVTGTGAATGGRKG